MHSIRESVRGTPVGERDRVVAERRLQRGVLVELVQHDFGNGVAFEFDRDAHTRTVRVVGEVGDLGQHLVVNEIGDLAG